MPETPEQMVERVRAMSEDRWYGALDRAALRYVLEQAESARQDTALLDAVQEAGLTIYHRTGTTPSLAPWLVRLASGHDATGPTVRAALAAWKARAGQ